MRLATVRSIVVLACAVQASIAFAEERRIEELLHKSGLWVQVGEVRAQLLERVARTRGDAPGPGLAAQGERAIARLVAAMRVAFSPERLRAALAHELASLLSRDDEETALAWLSSDLGTRVTRLEEASAAGEALRAYQREAPAFLATLSAARFEQCRRLASAVRAGEAAASTAIDMSAAIVYGAASTSRNPDPRLLETLRAGIPAERATLERALAEEAARRYAYAYRSLSDEDLGRYVGFLESPAGHRYSDASMQALQGTLTRASRDAGERLGDDSRSPAERS